MKRVLPLVALIAVGLGPMSCSNDNPISQAQFDAIEAQLDAAQEKAICLSRCEEDYSTRIPQCFNHFWDADKRDCVRELNQTFETCKRRCEEDFS